MDPATGMSTGKTFGTIEEGIGAAGQTIAKNWNNHGRTIEGMAGSYAPVGAANDPGKLNAGWPAGVRHYMQELSGPTKPVGVTRLGPGQVPSAGVKYQPNGVPSAILSKARDVALSGGAQGVFDYMRSQGYPMHSAWCGDFAASVVRGAGGTPPDDASVASNWRKWGKPVEGAPQPGDIAIRRGTPTGSTGSHVTIVESVNPDGTFVGLAVIRGDGKGICRFGGMTSDVATNRRDLIKSLINIRRYQIRRASLI